MKKTDDGYQDSKAFSIFNVDTREWFIGPDVPYPWGNFGTHYDIYKTGRSPLIENAWTLLGAKLTKGAGLSGPKHAVHIYSPTMNQEYAYVLGGTPAHNIDLFSFSDESITSLGDILTYNRLYYMNTA